MAFVQNTLDFDRIDRVYHSIVHPLLVAKDRVRTDAIK